MNVYLTRKMEFINPHLSYKSKSMSRVQINIFSLLTFFLPLLELIVERVSKKIIYDLEKIILKFEQLGDQSFQNYLLRHQ
jgi:hypothetical protein